jgi:hypothetical protein
MFVSYDWDKLSDQDKAFKCGYLVSKYQSAISDIGLSIMLISDDTVSDFVKDLIWMKADNAILSAANIDFRRFSEIEGYLEIAPFLPDKSAIKCYIDIRNQKGHISFVTGLRGFLALLPSPASVGQGC